MTIIVDAHQDIAWNIATFNRDYTRPVSQTRQLEHEQLVVSVNGDTLLGWNEYQQGRVGLVFATLFAAPERRKLGAWDTQTYRTTEEAYTLYHQQLLTYHRLADARPDHFRLIFSQKALHSHLKDWTHPKPDGHPVGMVILMENAEGIRSVAELEEWHALGVRIIGPAWTGTRFCGGTREPGPLTAAGRELLSAMTDYNFVLDLSHMDEQAALQALDYYEGPIIASHGNAAALLKHAESNRHLPDDVIAGVIERDGVVGVIPYALFLDDTWRKGQPRELISFERIADHIDHICQLAGDALHAGIGSDFDGGFGLQSVPKEIDSVADLHKIGSLLAARGYSAPDIDAVLGDNWLRLLKNHLPET